MWAIEICIGVVLKQRYAHGALGSKRHLFFVIFTGNQLRSPN